MSKVSMKYLVFTLLEEPTSELSTCNKYTQRNLGIFSSLEKAYDFCHLLTSSEAVPGKVTLSLEDTRAALNESAKGFGESVTMSQHIDYDAGLWGEVDSNPIMGELSFTQRFNFAKSKYPVTTLFLQRFEENFGVY